MLELPPDSERSYFYSLENEIPKELQNISIISTETYKNMTIFTVNTNDITEISSKAIKQSIDEYILPKKILCKHNNLFCFNKSTRLPQEGWEELIDCWSCHNCEFKSMLNLTPKPRINSILTSDFYFLVRKEDTPSCCINNEEPIKKYFFNEVFLNEYDSFDIIYIFFNTYYKNYNSFIFKYNEKNYELKFFYKTKLIDFKDNDILEVEALKIGMKETDKVVNGSYHLNQFYINFIYREICKKKLYNVQILGYDILYIFSHKRDNTK